MRRLIRLAALLYPSTWRSRYGREFDALLEDICPRPQDLLDTLFGALTMRMKTIAALPVAATLIGAAAGATVAFMSPVLYASASTIRLDLRDAKADPAALLQAAIGKTIGASQQARAATSAEMVAHDGTQLTVRLAYADPDPATALRVAGQLTEAVSTSGGTSYTATLVNAPEEPTSTRRRNAPASTAAGGAIGLVAGGVAAIIVSARRRRAA